MKRISTESVNQEYEAAILFNTGINLYDTVKVNEDFVIGKQWEGVVSNGLPTPVFNFLKRVVMFCVANVSTDNLKLHAKPLPSMGVDESTLETFSGILNDQFSAIFEHNKMSALVREFCRNAAVDGDGCMYTYWDPNMKTGQMRQGGIKTEVLLNTQVMFGNPNNRNVQSQPYILIERRMLIGEARRYAKRNGVSENDLSLIVADGKETGNEHIDELGGDKVTVILRLWRDDKTGNIHGYECTKTVCVRKEWDLGIDIYPIVWMNWDYIHDNYHGQAMITGLIPNQIFVNKLFALSMISLMTLAYPKIVYDKTKISRWSAKVGAAIGVNGNVDGVAKIIDPASISPQIYQFIDASISYTQKFLGASDVALGDTRPDNTSAIIALQRAAATPMELTKQSLLQAVEDLGRIYMAFEAEYYGERMVEASIPGYEGKSAIRFDFSALKDIPCSIDLDAGASSYWSEIASMQTLDNLLMQGRIPLSEYLERLPEGQITNRDGLIAVARAAERGQMMAVTQDGAMNALPLEDAQPGEELRGGGGYAALQRKINETGEVPKEA